MFFFFFPPVILYKFAIFCHHFWLMSAFLRCLFLRDYVLCCTWSELMRWAVLHRHPVCWEDWPAMCSTPLYKPNQISRWAEVKPFMTDPTNKLALLKVETTHSTSRSQLSRWDLASSSVSLNQTSGVRQSCIFTVKNDASQGSLGNVCLLL